MADKFKVIDPYESYEMTPQSDAEGIKGNDFLNSVKSLQVGFGSKVLRIDRDGMWLGAADFASAPFSVDMEGNMIATSLDLSDYLQVGDALGDVQSDIFDLSDIDADLGVITAGTLIGLDIRGSLIRTSTSGGRVEIDDGTDSLEIYDNGGERRIELDNDELIFYNSSGAERGGLTANTTELYLTALNGGNLHLEAEGSLYVITFSVNGNTVGYFTQQGLNMDDNDILNCDTISANGNEIDIGGSSTRIRVNEDFEPDSDGSHDLGGSSSAWQDIYGDEVHYGTLTATSDRRRKRNISPSSYGLKEVLKLDPITFQYKKKTVDENAPRLVRNRIKNPEKAALTLAKTKKNLERQAAKEHIGFIAQDVRKILPLLVEKEKDQDLLTLNSVELIPVLVKAIQELSAEVEELKK